MIIRIRDEQTQNRTIDAILEAPKDGSVQVEIKPYRKNRTLSQNSLMWMWLTVHGKQVGHFKDDLYVEFKKRFCLPILLRDDPELQVLYNRACEDVRIESKFYDLIHTSSMDVKQLAEALTEYDHWCGSNGIPLPHPEDLYYEAMGR